VESSKRFRRRGGHLFDVDASLCRQHEERLLLASVEGHREVVLLRDLRCLLDPEGADDVTPDVEPEDLTRASFRLGRPMREPDPTGLAAAADQHLRLDHHLPADGLGRRARLLGRRRDSTLRHWNPEVPKELLPLVLVEIHGARV
jgi:hypothetical protein